MDHTMIDLGPQPNVKLFDDVTLFGPGNNARTPKKLPPSWERFRTK